MRCAVAKPQTILLYRSTTRRPYCNRLVRNYTAGCFVQRLCTKYISVLGCLYPHASNSLVPERFFYYHNLNHRQGFHHDAFPLASAIDLNPHFKLLTNSSILSEADLYFPYTFPYETQNRAPFYRKRSWRESTTISRHPTYYVLLFDVDDLSSSPEEVECETDFSS